MNAPTRPVALALLLAAPALGQQPPAPVARPVDPLKTASSRVVVAVQPVGKLPYDGVTLPLVSPDGKFFATQTGRTASWETLLAQRGQSTPSGLRISLFQLSFPALDSAPADKAAAPDPKHPPKPPSLSPYKPDEPPQTGLLLGRSADSRGFLVEAPQPPEPGETGDGARWIGRIHWLTGRLEWLVRGDRVNAHAVLPPDHNSSAASLAFVRRNADGRAFQLVVRTGGAASDTEVVQSTGSPDVTYAFPIFSAEGKTLGVLSLPADDAEGPIQLCSFDLSSQPGATTARATLRALGRLELGRTPGGGSGLHAAFQCVAALQSPTVMPAIPAGESSSPARDLFMRGLTIFSPRDGAIVWWEPREDHVLTLAHGSFAAAPFQHADFGFVLAGPGTGKPAKPGRAAPSAGANTGTTGDLLYQPLRLLKDREPPEPSLGREVAVVSGGSIPRATTLEGGITVLLAAPGSGQLDSFDVLLMAPAKADEP